MRLAQTYHTIFSQIDWFFFLISAIIFFSGILFTPFVIKRKINFLVKYPTRILAILEKYLNMKKGCFSLFTVIFSLNMISLAIDFLAGWSVILPFIFAFFTGLNIAIISYQIGGMPAIFTLLFNPVAFLELPAAWFALTAGMQLSKAIWIGEEMKAILNQFYFGIDVFFHLTIPLLLIAALIEAGMIHVMRAKLERDDDIK